MATQLSNVLAKWEQYYVASYGIKIYCLVSILLQCMYLYSYGYEYYLTYIRMYVISSIHTAISFLPSMDNRSL